MDVFQPALHVIEPVFTFTTFIELTGDGDRIEFGRQEIFSIVESQADLCQSARTPAFRPIENQAFEVFTPQVTDFMFSDNPAYGVHDVTFTTSVGADNTRDSLIKIHNGFVCKTFKTLDL